METNDEYQYIELLHRIYKKMDIIKEKSFILQPPKMYYINSKKCVWLNFQETCNTLNRSFKHLIQYISDIFKISCKINKNKIFILKYSHQYNNIKLTSILNTYIKKYVKCNNCNNMDTMLVNDINYICKSCNHYN